MIEEKYCGDHKMVVRHTNGKCNLCTNREKALTRRRLRDISDKSQTAGSVSDFSKLFSGVAETKDPLADPKCGSCEGRGFYHVLDVGEYDEQQTTVQCSCKRKQNERGEFRPTKQKGLK